MKPPLISRSRHIRTQRRQERGVTIVLVAIAMVAIIAMAVLSIDMVTLYLAREEAQRSADAAALTAARYLSLSGVTGDPDNTGGGGLPQPPWPPVCNTATLLAQAVAGQNAVGGTAATTVNVTFLYNGTTTDCTSKTGGGFALNPQVKVQVVRQGLPTLFSRIWSRTPNSVSATATAEAFNPSNSGSVSPSESVVPVVPRCVKPWLVPNKDPGNSSNPFVSLADGSIQNPGISLNGGGSPVIGEHFTLFADCASGTPCVPPDNQLQADVGKGNKYNGKDAPNPPNLEYLPGAAPAASVAVPSCAASAGYQGAVAGCDQATNYQCGVPSSVASTPNLIDVSENPGGDSGDTATGLACSLTGQTSVPLSGQDSLDTSAYPFKIIAGSANPLGINGSTITASNSIVSLPIYDSSAASITFNNNQAAVTIVGFLQVFINQVNGDGTLDVTVLNVAGCSSNTSNPPVNGSSPVPVRLITSP